MKGKFISQILLKWKVSLLWKTLLRESEDKLQNEIKHLENKYLEKKKNLYSKYTKSSSHLRINTQASFFFLIWAKSLDSLFTKVSKNK